MNAILQQCRTGRADLLHAYATGGDDGLRAAAHLLGYVEVLDDQEPLRLDATKEAADRSEKVSPVASTQTPTQIEYKDIPFWRAVAVERAEDHQPGDEAWEVLTRKMLKGDKGAPAPIPPEAPPLVAWPVLARVLDDRLRSPRESLRVDVDRLASLWCRGRVPRRLPRQIRRHLGRVTVFVDRDRRLAPFFNDQVDLLLELISSLPPTDLRILRSPKDGAISTGAFDENDVVLVLGDLGFYDDSSESWLRLARRLGRTGARLWALVPCPPRLWHAATARAWSATDWSAPDVAPGRTSPTAAEQAIQDMLRLLSMAVRIEPALVRSLRRLVPAADCGTEVELQFHPDLSTGSSSAWQFAGTAIQEWRQSLTRLPRDLLRAAAEVVILWHRHLSFEVRAELAEILRSLGIRSSGIQSSGLQCDEALGVTAAEARRVFEGIAAALEQAGSADRSIVSAAETWLPRVADQLPPSVWRGRLSKSLVRAYRAYKEKHPNAPPPPGVTTEMLDGRASHRPVERWDVRQVGDRLRIEPANAWGEGSFLASISAREPEILWVSERQAPALIDAKAGLELPADLADGFRLVTDIEEVILESCTGPPWASRVGRDGFGLWAALEIGGIEQRLRWIPPGRFEMGSPKEEAGRSEFEGPQHSVTLTEGYWMAETPCTQELWQAATGKSPSHFEGEQRPVEKVSWQEVQEFLDRLSFQVRGLEARLPTEAEWEHACRAGTEGPTWLGDTWLEDNRAEVLDQIAIYRQNSDGQSKEVGDRVPNPRWLGDMLGNVHEWCWDWQGSYRSEPTIDPEGPLDGSYRVLRGGSWGSDARLVRAASRNWNPPGSRTSIFGFRLSLGPRERGAPSSEQPEAAPKAVGRGTSPRARSRRSGAWVDRIEWAVDGGRDAHGRWAAFEVEGVKHRLRWIYPGRFQMGSPESEAGRFGDEGPVHAVELTEGFWLGEVPCTQALYEAVTGENPSEFRSPERPVEKVDWQDCRRFFEQLGPKVPGFSGRLPTEAQWEYACRAGTESATWLGNLEILGKCNAPLLDEMTWYAGNSGIDFELVEGWDSSDWEEKQYPHDRAGTHVVGLKPANPWGLYDMLGNVLEWCEDAWDGQSGYPIGNRVDPLLTDGSSRVLRGGSWDSNAQSVRAAYRYWSHPGNRHSSLGFRLSSGPVWRMPK